MIKDTKNELIILSASLVSTLGTGILTIANALVISETMGTAKAIGTLFILIALPQAFFSLLFGKFADIFNRKHICIMTNIVNMFIVLGMLLGINTLVEPTITIFIGGFLLSMTTAMFFPANNALIKDSIAADRMATFNSKLEMVMQIGALTSVAIGGFLIQYIGVNFVYLLNAITFLISASLFSLITIYLSVLPNKNNEMSILEKSNNMTEKYWLMLLYGIGNIIITVSNVLMVVLIIKYFKSGAGMLGLVDALAGIGIAISVIAIPFFQKRFTLLTVIYIGYIGDALFIFLQPQFHLIGFLIFFPIGAFFFGIARISCRTLMFNSISSHHTGRFFGMSNALGLFLSVITVYLISDLIDNYDVILGYVALAITVATLVTCILFFVKIKGA